MDIKKYQQMKYLIITIFVFKILIQAFNSNAQNLEENLKKYWYYRERFKREFIVIDPFNRQGTNIPATRRIPDSGGDILKWGDS